MNSPAGYLASRAPLSTDSGSAPQRQLDVPSFLERISSNLNNLEAAQNELAMRLRVISHQDPPLPVDGKGEAKQPQVSCEVVDALRTILDRVQAATERVNNMTGHLEI